MEIKEALEILKEQVKHYSCTASDCPCKYQKICRDIRDESCDPVREGSTVYKANQIVIEALEKKKNNGWIPVSKRLPEEIIDKLTRDFTEYNVSLKFDDKKCVRTYKFGNERWWNNGADMTKYVVAWQPLPETYKEVENG